MSAEEKAALDLQFGALIRYLRSKGMEAHTTRGQTLIIRRRRPKRSRLTGRLK